VDVPGGGTATLPGSAPVDGWERCRSADGRWQAVRVEQPGMYGYDALYVVRNGDGAVFAAGRWDVSDLVVGGIAVLDEGLLLYGGDGGWFTVAGEGEAVRVGDFVPALP
jgi:hypothetical protein